jgi:hypothetical protein
VTFRIGAVERVKKLKSTESPSPSSLFEMTSLTGRVGMSCGSQEKLATIRVKLGRHVDVNATSLLNDSTSATSVRLG